MPSRRNLGRFTALALCVALVGCARGPRDGGASGRRPDKARKDAEALAVRAVHGAADAQAKALPELRQEPEPPAEHVREQRSQERLGPAVRALSGLVAVALAGFLFLRIDRRTNGALTLWLALGALVLAAGGVAAAILV
jgi:hypothetical protein